ncbi:DNA-directed DNA polymerase [Elasticomyces elasticus]|nr:DNA-directed DNA polymerase [Elasticomyces elasticus]
MAQKRRIDDTRGGTSATGANGIPRKRRKETSETDAQLRKIYDELANEVSEVRLKAAKRLILLLFSEHEADPETIDKVLVRLIRGLCSSRKGARFGFSVALTETLRNLYSGQKEGRSLTKSDLGELIDRVTSLTEPEGSASSQAVLTERMDHAFALEILTSLCACGLAKTPEGVAIWLTAVSLFPDLQLPNGVWQKQDPLDSKNRTALAQIMRAGQVANPEIVQSMKSNVGTPQSTPNFAWKIVFASLIKAQKYLPLDHAESLDTDFAKFWLEAVDHGLFASSSSPERKSLGFHILTNMIDEAPGWALRTVFSPNLMRCIFNQRNSAERYLHEAAKLPLDHVLSRVKHEPGLASVFVQTLLVSGRDDLNLDRITQSRTIEGCLALADSAAVSEVTTFLRPLILRPSKADKAERWRQTIADLLLSAVRGHQQRTPEPQTGAIDENHIWIPVFKLLIECAYCDPTSSASAAAARVPPVSADSSKMFQSRLLSCLTHVIFTMRDESVFYPYFVACQIRDCTGSEDLELSFWGDKMVRKAIKRSHKILDQIAQERGDNVFTRKQEPTSSARRQAALRAFKLLYSVTLIQAYNEEPDAIAILDELETCYTSRAEKGPQDENSFTLLVEVLLSYMAKPSVLFRRLAEQVFGTFASELTADSLQSLLDILAKKENLGGQQELFDQQNDEEDTGDGDTDDVEEASDVEVSSLGRRSSGTDSEEHSEEESEEESEEAEADTSDASIDEAEPADDDEVANFEALLRQTLRTETGDSADDSDGSDMTDTQMTAVDAHLSQVFRQRSQQLRKKTQHKDARATIVNFKNRVLDLLLLYIRQESASALALDLILPLLALVRETRSRQIATRAVGLLERYFNTCGKRKAFPRRAEPVAVRELLRRVGEEAGQRRASKAHANVCASASRFLEKVLLRLGTE